MPAATAPLLTLTITEDGEIHASPGTNFTPEHVDLLVDATAALQELVTC